MTVTKWVRSTVRFSLAAFLWLHALFLLNLSPSLTLTRVAQWTHLSTAEIGLFLLLLTFSFVAGGGFWRSFGNAAYIYGFPFVLLFYLFFGIFLVIRALWRAFSTPCTSAIESNPAATQLALPMPYRAETANAPRRSWSKLASSVCAMLLRPFRRFTILWGWLVLVASSEVVLWLAVSVLLLHIAGAVFKLLRLTVFSGFWYKRFEEVVRQYLDNLVSRLTLITSDAAPTPDLRGLWTSIKAVQTCVRLLENEPVIERFGIVLCLVFLVGVHIYFALLFSFGYYGIARFSSAPLSWPESFVTAVFVPFLIDDLPRSIALKALAGIQCTLVVSMSVGTFIRYFRGRMAAFRSTVTVITVRLGEETVREKYSILEQKFADEKGKPVFATETKS